VEEVLAFAFAVKAADREIQRRMNEQLRPYGITAAQAEAIVVIGETQPVSLKELGALLIAEAGHPSRLVDRLVEAGYVRREAAGDDRRRVELSLTEKGRVLQGHITRAQQTLLTWGREVLAGQDLPAAIAAAQAIVAGGPLAEVIARRQGTPVPPRPTRSGE
jgi:MarR family transcriptional regulator, organic hydroperoxide resistance regulator